MGEPSTDTGGPGDPGDPATEGLAYADALAELERILDTLESDRVDVDTLATRVERAAALIRLCRSRLGAARTQVEAVVGELGEEAADDTD
jgi:exodeoxyribonuclease VII small subunit